MKRNYEKKVAPIKDMKFAMNNDGKIYIIKIVHDDFFGYCEIDNTDVMKWKRMSFASFKKHQPRLIQVINNQFSFVIDDEIFNNSSSAARYIRDNTNEKVILWQVTEDLEALTRQLHEDQTELYAEVHDVDVKVQRR